MKKKDSSDQYYTSFDLKKDPFPIETYDNVLFLTPELTNRLLEIKRLVAETDKMIIVSSVSGAGKSTLADYLESIKEKNWIACLVQAEQDMDRNSLSYEIIQQVSPDKADDIAMSISLLHKFLEFSSKTEKQPVLIIDDADKLPLETLEFILELSALKYQESCFHFVLFANEAITDKLFSEQLGDIARQLITTVHLPSLSKTQLKEYIDNRLSSSGEISEYPFSNDEIDEIYNVSGGLPRGVNILARKHMMERSMSGMQTSTLMKVSAAAIVVILVSAGYLYMSSPDDFEESTPTVSAVAPPQPLQPPAAAIPPPPEELTLANENDAVVPQQEAAPAVAQSSLATETGDSMTSLNGRIEETPDVSDGPGELERDDDSVAIEMVTAEQETPATTVTEAVDPGQETGDATAIETASSMPGGQSVSAPSTQQTVEEVPEPPVAVTSARIPSVAGVDSNIYKLDSIPALVRGLKGENWYRQQPRSSFVLQLISASDIDNVLSLLEGLDDFHEDMSGYVKYTPSGRPRYLLFFGQYPDRQIASGSTSSIPEKLRSISPYPRSIGSIIDEIETVGSYPY